MKRVIRMKDVVKIVGLSRSTLWRLQKEGEFIDGVRLSANSVGYFASDVEAWLASRPMVQQGGNDPK